MAFCQGVVVDLAGSRAFFELPVNDAIANVHSEVGHRGATWQRKDIGRFQGLTAGVDKCLAHGHFAHQSGDVDPYIHGLERQVSACR